MQGVRNRRVSLFKRCSICTWIYEKKQHSERGTKQKALSSYLVSEANLLKLPTQGNWVDAFLPKAMTGSLLSEEAVDL